MQISNINRFNFQIYNNIRENIVSEEPEKTVVPQNFYAEHENYQLPPFFVYDKFSKNLNNLRKNKILWSSEKIMEMTELALDKFSDLINENNVSVKSANKILSDILPSELSNCIKYMNYNTDFVQFIKNKNKFTDEQAIQFSEVYRAFVSGDEKGNTLIFVPFEDVYKSNYDRAMCKNYFAHELKHALTSNATNTEQNDLLAIGNDKLASKYSEFFKSLEQTYDFDFKDNSEKLLFVELTNENFFKNVMKMQTGQTFESDDDFIADFEDEIVFLLNELNLTKNTLKSNAFLNYISHYSVDEKEAYSFQKVLRELNADKSKTIKIELRLLKYEFFEKYFKSLSETFY